jgi:dTMP kinase
VAERSQAGRFITIEGIEGVGKSTNVNFIADYFRAKGDVVHITREPGGTEIAERIRNLILETPGDGLSDTGELLLMFAARAEHLAGLIRPALERGETVICDRFIDASFAYQGGGRGLDHEVIGTLRDIVLGKLRPDLTILLDAPTEVSAERIAGREWQDRFEQERAEFFARVRSAYLDIAGREPERVRIVDASQPLPAVQAAITDVLVSTFI